MIIKALQTHPGVQVVKKEGFGRRIAEARRLAGYSQKALMAELGWPSESNARLSSYETEVNEPRLDDFIAIGKKCGVDPAYLAFGEVRLDPAIAEFARGYLTAEPHIKESIRALLRINERNNKGKSNE